MGYFQNPKNDIDLEREQDWTEVLDQIQNWSIQYRKKLSDISHPLEAKALYMFTMSRRLVRSVHKIGGDEINNWPSVYVETYVLLFPMLELIGKAVHSSKSQSYEERLAAGLYWLNEPDRLPDRVYDPPKSKSNNTPQNDSELLDNLPHIDANINKPSISDLIKIRNYLLHGVSGQTGETWAMNYQHPRSMAIQAEIAMREYWKQLTQDSGNSGGWIDRLAQAQIEPFPIPGSVSYEKCLIDHDIVEYLTDRNQSCFASNRNS